jgi:hypothetical protein
VVGYFWEVVMPKSRLPGWGSYWTKYSDLNLLRKRYSNLDVTFKMLEKEFDCKLMSGDHMLIIAGLEDRIEELRNTLVAQSAGVQVELFEN